MRWPKGQSGNPKGPTPGKHGMSQVVRFNLKMAARVHCPKALKVIAECMKSKDERVRLMAASIILDRGYGKPKEQVDAEIVHRFAEVPQVMEQELWLRTRGGTIPDPLALPPPDDPDRKPN